MKRMTLCALALGVIAANAAQAEKTDGQSSNSSSGDDVLLNQVIVVGDNFEGRTASVGRMDAEISETPYSVSVITEDFFTATGVKTLQDALQYSAGVNGASFGIDTRTDSSTIRGVAPILYLDGMRKSVGSFNNTRQNPFTLERIEVLKGPASVGYGQSGTGGIVNMVSKRPQSEFGGEVWAQVGTFDRKQLAVDVTGSIDDDGEWLYRVVALGRDAESQTDMVDDNSTIFMPSLTWNPSAQTSLTFMVNRQEDETGSSTQFLPHAGTILPNPNGRIDQTVFLSEPEFDRFDTEQTAYTMSFDHIFNEVFSLSANYRDSQSESEYRTMYPLLFPAQFQPLIYPGSQTVGFAADGRTLNRTALASDRSADAKTLDIRLNADFRTGPAEHRVVFGLDAQDITTDNDSANLNDTATLFRTAFLPALAQAGGNPLDPFNSPLAAQQAGVIALQQALLPLTIDVYNPQYGKLSADARSALKALKPVNGPSSTLKQQGIYLMDQIRYKDLVVSTGVRHDSVKNSTQGKDSDKDNETTYQLGALYQLSNGVSPYVSYAESFEAIPGTDSVTKKRYKPASGEQTEIGVKYQPEGTKLLVTAAYYQIDEKNRLITNPANPLGRIQAESEINGYELEAQGSLGQFDFIASYTNLDANRKPQAGGSKTKLEAVPEEQASAWVTYRLADELTGLRVGLGSRYVGKTYDGTDNKDLETDAYTLFDAMVGYEMKNWFFSVNGRNITDKRHLNSCLSRGDCFAGEERTVSADVRYKF
ncbi:TonB-dependent siderophore receptor [Bacterioplanoides sp.]|uniref:TonB-dependent siderophore receptor n=1 Tax=Bacterioplanoides sp. TaxID=2066072 RepID=UPI003B59937A